MAPAARWMDAGLVATGLVMVGPIDVMIGDMSDVSDISDSAFHQNALDNEESSFCPRIVGRHVARSMRGHPLLGCWGLSA